MIKLKNIMLFKSAAHGFFALCMFFAFGSYFAGEDAREKISPSMKLSYKILNGNPSVKVEISYKEGKATIPVNNLIVNLYLTEKKKYNPSTGEGWMGNMVTDEDGVAIFDLTDNFKRIKTGAHSFNFIARFTTDLKYEDSEEQITVNDVKINLSSSAADSLTTVMAKFVGYKDSVEAPLAKTEIKLLIKRTFGMLPFGEDGLTTDDNGEASGVLPADVPGNDNKTITVVARYEDQENDGIIEVTEDIAWAVPPIEREQVKRSLWSSGQNAPVPLVIITVSMIGIIWGIIFYLIALLFKIKKLSKQ